MVIRDDLEPLGGMGSSCTDLIEEQSCIQAAIKTPPAIADAQTDLDQLRVPAGLVADTTVLRATLARVAAACPPVLAARGRVPEGYANNEFATAQNQLSSVLAQIASDANAI